MTAPNGLQERATEVREHLNRQINEMLAMLERFVNQESGSREKNRVDEMGRVYRQVIEPLGFSTEVIPQSTTGDHLIFRRKWNGFGRVLILSHIDTVWPSGTVDWWPFTVQNGRATGPGVGDMKGGIVGAIYAIKAVEDLGLSLPSKLTFFFTGDEELGSPSAREIIEREAREHDYVLVTEPSDIEGAVITGRGGIGAFKIDVTGKTAHAGAGPAAGASAISALARKIVALDGLSDWQNRIGVNVGLIEGGSARQVSAGHASAWLDLRVPDNDARDRVWQRVQEIIQREDVLGITATISGAWTRPPSPETEANHALFERAAEVAEALGFTLTGRQTAGGSDGSFTSALGISTLDGLGPNTGDAVSSGEYILIDSLPERSALIALLLDRLARQTGEESV